MTDVARECRAGSWLLRIVAVYWTGLWRRAALEVGFVQYGMNVLAGWWHIVKMVK